MPHGAGIVRKELAFDFAPLVSFHSLYRSFDIVLGFLAQCTVAALKSFLFLFQFYFTIDEQRLIVAEHYQSFLGNTQVQSEAYV